MTITLHRATLGGLRLDRADLDEAVLRVLDLVEDGSGGIVVPSNVATSRYLRTVGLPRLEREAAFWPIDGVPLTWLLRIAINEGLMRLRRSRRLEVVAEPESISMISSKEQAVPSADAVAENRELLGVLGRVVDTLPEPYRLVFVLREVEELSTAETADALQLSEDVVKTRLHRARTMIRDAVLEELGPKSRELFTFGAARCDRVVEAVLRKIGEG